jgi:hypothetical protein
MITSLEKTLGLRPAPPQAAPTRNRQSTKGHPPP